MKPDAVRRVAKRKHISASVVSEALDFAWSSTRCELESDPIEYGQLVGPADSLLPVLPAALPAREKILIRSGPPGEVIRKFGGPYKWNRLALLVDPDTSEIQGSVDLETLKVGDPYEYISAVTSSICVVTKQAFSVRVYYDGSFRVQYIFNRKSGLIEERELDGIVSLLEPMETTSAAVRKLLDTSLRISELRKGALIVLGALPRSLLSSNATNRISHFLPRSISSLSFSALIGYATQDGATWIDSRGNLRGYNLPLVGEGGRHAIAKDLASKSDHSDVIVVSQDGEINRYWHGNSQRVATQGSADCLFSGES